MPHQDHRKETVARVHVKAPGALATRTLDRVEIRDLSPCGLFLACHPAPAPGSQVTVRFKLPGERNELELVGEVRHRSAEGAGIRTIRLEYETRNAIESYARAHREAA